MIYRTSCKQIWKHLQKSWASAFNRAKQLAGQRADHDDGCATPGPPKGRRCLEQGTGRPVVLKNKRSDYHDGNTMYHVKILLPNC